MSAKEKKAGKSEDPAIARNRKARFEFEVLEKFEAGIELVGSEVKSLRNGDVSISEAFVRPRENELWVLGMNIKPYAQANILNHDPVRPRKLLMHRREIERLIGKTKEKGLTLVPTRAGASITTSARRSRSARRSAPFAASPAAGAEPSVVFPQAAHVSRRIGRPRATSIGCRRRVAGHPLDL
jgi:SsrA-binding protein